MKYSEIEFESNIVVYNYSDYANNLIQNLRNTNGLKTRIRVWDNSPKPLHITGADEVRWNRFNPSLSRTWNWAIGQSETQWVMVTNDDIQLKEDWYVCLKRDMESHSESLWHGPSRCFLFNKQLIQSVGWFDERLTGITYEDLDYVRRMNHAGVYKLYNQESSLWVKAKSLKDEIVRPLRPASNIEFFMTKYDNWDTENFHDTPKFHTPDWYPLRSQE